MQKYHPEISYEETQIVKAGKLEEGLKDSSEASIFDVIVTKFYKERVNEPEKNSNRLAGCNGTKPCVFFVRGGGFIYLDPQGDTTNPIENINIAASLADSGYVTYSIEYKTVSSDNQATNTWKNSMRDLFNVNFPGDFPIYNDCKVSNNTAKCAFEKFGIRALWDVRKFINLTLTNACVEDIDTSKVFLIGHSAGAQLVLHYTFMDGGEIPANVSTPCPTGNGPGGSGGSSIPNAWRTDSFPIVRPAGIIALSASTLYDTIFNNNTSYFGANGIPILLMHGTRDRIINQDTGRVPFRCENPNRCNYTKDQNQWNRYPFVIGSKNIFVKLWNKGAKVRFEQVCEGEHDILTNYNTNFGSWNDETPVENNVYNRIVGFLNAVKLNSFQTGIGSFIPDTKNTQSCVKDSTYCIPITNVIDTFENVCTNRFLKIINGGGNTAILSWWKIGNQSWKYTFEPKYSIPNIVNNYGTKLVKAVTQNGCCIDTSFAQIMLLEDFCAQRLSNPATSVQEEDIGMINFNVINSDEGVLLYIPWIEVASAEEKKVQFIVNTISGQRIWEKNLSLAHEVFRFPLDCLYELPKGIYTITMLCEGKVNTKLITK